MPIQTPPAPGTTMKAYCDCVKAETTWNVLRYDFASDQYANVYKYKYYWVCLNCEKKREIGIFLASQLP